MAGVFIVALAIYFLWPLFQPPLGAEVLVTLDGREYARLHIGQPQTLTIDCGDGENNVLVVDDQGVYMQSATCRDQLCVSQGKVTVENYSQRALGGDIICLPHRLVCSLLPAQSDDTAPD